MEIERLSPTIDRPATMVAEKELPFQWELTVVSLMPLLQSSWLTNVK
jgi:hypothetical protein